MVLLAVAGCGRLDFDALDGTGGTGDGGTSGDGAGSGDGGNTGDGGGTGDGSTAMFNYVFVTSTSARLADLGGVAGADAECNSLAAAQGLPGTYVAWLSDVATAAPERLGSARGWVRVDGKPVADTVADLVAGKLLHPILLTETGTAYTGQFGIFTTTNANGTLAGDCDNFTLTSGGAVMTGIASATRDTWTQNMALDCDEVAPHYCFGVDRNEPLTYAPATGRRAFVTSATWPPSGGVTAADTACQAAADAQSLGGVWRALIATTTASAADRFDPGGGPWVRLDGIALASTGADLLSGENLDAPLNLTETMQYRGSNPAQTGATSTTALGASNSTCLDWSSSQSTDTQRVGLLNSITLYFSTPIFQTCNSGGSLYCLEP
jgi:hypothetical protein